MSATRRADTFTAVVAEAWEAWQAYARHLGHADLLRGRIDGRRGR